MIFLLILGKSESNLWSMYLFWNDPILYSYFNLLFDSFKFKFYSYFFNDLFYIYYDFYSYKLLLSPIINIAEWSIFP